MTSAKSPPTVIGYVIDSFSCLSVPMMKTDRIAVSFGVQPSGKSASAGSISKPDLQPCLNPVPWNMVHGPRTGVTGAVFPQKLVYVFIIRELWGQQKPPSVLRKSTNCGTPTPLRIDPKIYGNLPLLSLVSMCSCSISTLT